MKYSLGVVRGGVRKRDSSLRTRKMKRFVDLGKGTGVGEVSHGPLTSFFFSPCSNLRLPGTLHTSLPKWLSSFHLFLLRKAVFTTVWQAGSLVHHGTGSTVRKLSLEI